MMVARRYDTYIPFTIVTLLNSWFPNSILMLINSDFLKQRKAHIRATIYKQEIFAVFIPRSGVVALKSKQV
jgi:hypothetical protein